MKTINEMSPSEKALLITAISEALKANKVVGTYEKLEHLSVDKLIEIIKSIK